MTGHGLRTTDIIAHAREWQTHGKTYHEWVNALLPQIARVAGEDLAAGVPREMVDAASRQSLESMAAVVLDVWGVDCVVSATGAGGLAGFYLRVVDEQGGV